MQQVLILDRTELLPNGAVQVRWRKAVSDGQTTVELNEYHRTAYGPGDDITELPEDTQVVIAAHWTQARLDLWDADQAQFASEAAGDEEG